MAEIDLPKIDYTLTTDANKGVYGAYKIKVMSDKVGSFKLLADDTIAYAINYTGRKVGDEDIYISPDYEYKKRKSSSVKPLRI